MVQQKLQSLIDSLNAVLADAEKCDKGNNAAGTRVRAACQAAKVAAQDIRAEVMKTRD